MIARRRLLARGLALAPPAAAVLAACGDDGAWPEGMVAFKWDRDVCARCGMVISDRRFAVQLRGGPKNEAVKFDDIGCATSWCAEKHARHPWATEPATRWWVAEFGSPGPRWLDARRAHYLPGKTSPMGYNYGAVAGAQPGSEPFETMAEKTAATWPANCRPAAQAALTGRTGPHAS